MRFALPLVALALVAQTAPAQSPATLTLDDAIVLARRNNPAFHQTVNASRSADAQLRSAYASLLPSVSANMSGRYQKSGQQFVQGVSLGNSLDVLQSSYSLGAQWTLNSAVLFAPTLYRAQSAAAEADVTGAAELLRATVTQQYLTVLQAQARAALQDTLVQTTQGQLELAKARQAVGAGTILDVRRAEVALGQSEVTTLQAKTTAAVEMLRLFQLLGVPQPENVALTTRFDIATPNFELDSLKQLAQRANPGVQALRSRETAANAGVNAQRGQYLPTVTLTTGVGGNSSAYADASKLVSSDSAGMLQNYGFCSTNDSLRVGAGLAAEGCSRYVWTPARADFVRQQNGNFPFKFQNAPRSVSAFISMPIFDNLQREQRLQEAVIQRDNAKLTVRARELQLTADVTQAYLNLQTASKTVQMQEINAQRAREELSFAEERYKVGAATFLDVTTSRGTFEQAQIDRLNSIYDYHRAFAALENAVGRPLR